MKIDEIFTVDLTFTTERQIHSEDFIIFCDLLRKHEVYEKQIERHTRNLFFISLRVGFRFRWYQLLPARENTSQFSREIEASKSQIKIKASGLIFSNFNWFM